jgi:hypothetical protein
MLFRIRNPTTAVCPYQQAMSLMNPAVADKRILQFPNDMVGCRPYQSEEAVALAHRVER